MLPLSYLKGKNILVHKLTFGQALLDNVLDRVFPVQIQRSCDYQLVFLFITPQCSCTAKGTVLGLCVSIHCSATPGYNAAKERNHWPQFHIGFLKACFLELQQGYKKIFPFVLFKNTLSFRIYTAFVPIRALFPSTCSDRGAIYYIYPCTDQFVRIDKSPA